MDQLMNFSKCINDALTLVEDCENTLPEIKQLYNQSIDNRDIDSRLLVKIKNTLENLRSALDFCANAMVDKYSHKKPKRVYFPYATLSVSKERFLSEKRIEKAIPNLDTGNPDLYQMIIEMQHFSNRGAKWFPEFMELNNKNKHVHLVPNSINEGVQIQPGAFVVSAKGIRIGPNGGIATPNGTIKGPLEITPESIKRGNKYDGLRAKAWVEINIEDYGFPLNAYQFIEHCVRAIASVVRHIGRKMP
ncbi:MAG: hypothetical protein MI976_29195 [Pseudomonadales bacterium]|nr:hypothetical protein [Pseudomonadales bacterium]